MELVAQPTTNIVTLDGVECRVWNAQVKGGPHDGERGMMFVHRVGFDGPSPFGEMLMDCDRPDELTVPVTIPQGGDGAICEQIAASLRGAVGSDAAMVMIIRRDGQTANFESRIVAGELDDSVACEALERLLRTVRDDLGLPRLVPEANHEASNN